METLRQAVLILQRSPTTTRIYFLRLPRTPGFALEVSAGAVAWRLFSLDSSKGILGWRASWCICIDLTSGAVTLQRGHSSLAWPPFSWPDLSARPALPPPLLVVAASTLAAISLAVCFFGLAFPVMIPCRNSSWWVAGRR
ncbi:hypothetical protein M9H77_34966 [Catharanthus roseus]|uniref:Uncharacterized protein n=1 Tax=Catharanthus roseus TaxID=4058 RepID=A0ACB9ZNW7_CATRO|nr:hypothetical protein M9H77_34966 [Catharanthus roseus]